VLRRLQIALIACLLLCMPATLARERGEVVHGMSKGVYDVINEAQLLMDEEKYEEAMAALESQRSRRMSDYETAHVLNMIGYTWYQMDNMEKAAATYKEALAQEKLPGAQRRGLLTTVAQLSLLEEDYTGAESYARKLLAIPDKRGFSPIDHVILAQALYGQERYAEAVEPLKTAMEQQRELGQKPRENWLALLSSIYFETGDYQTMREVVYELVTLYPKEQYLMNLAALHGQLGETDRQLALVESLLDDNRLQRGHYLLNMANLFLAHQLPYKAARLLETEIASGRIEESQKNLELQSQAWYLAGEEARAIPPLEAAAELSEDGEIYLRVARLYMDLYNWKDAERAAGLALGKGGLRDSGSAHLLQGMALTRLNHLQGARRQFVKAAESEDSARWARQWLKFIDSEERRIAALQ
jgi:tetratricopeptide (TPR) repeat protein